MNNSRSGRPKIVFLSIKGYAPHLLPLNPNVFFFIFQKNKDEIKYKSRMWVVTFPHETATNWTLVKQNTEQSHNEPCDICEGDQ